MVSFNNLTKTSRAISICFLFFCTVFPLTAQNSISGTITDMQNNPLSLVTVSTENRLKWTTTNKDGKFSLQDIDQQEITLLFSRLGLKEEKRHLVFEKKSTIFLHVQLKEDNLGLEEVVVTGNLKSKRQTITVIKRQAIDHLQASSLADVLQLVPGQLIQNQNFDQVKQALIRQKDTRDGAEDATSFGTNIRINGITQSNNANLQNASSALRGNVNYFNSTAGRGIDLRTISTNNIEKIEVIKGIPAASYGDLSSGVILIETKKGASPLEVTQRITPKVYQTAINKGYSFTDQSTLNIDLDYTKAIQNEREKLLNYKQIRGNLTYVRPLFSNRVKTTSILNLQTLFDGNNDNTQSTQRKNEQQNFQFSFKSEWFANAKWFDKINFEIATSYTNQESYNKEIVNKPLSVLSLFTDTAEGPGIFLPQTYISEVTVKGKPFSFYTKVTNEFIKNTGAIAHHFLMGLEYNFEKNFGQGVSFNPNRPPEGLGYQTLRERPFNQVPSLRQLSFFVEDNMKFSVFGTSNTLALGLRFDNFQPESLTRSRYGIQISPRINFSSKVSKTLILKGGWGIATKSPSLLYLYPDRAFFDLISLNHFTGNPSENLVIMSTHAFDTTNKNLKVAKSTKFELGFNYSLKNLSIDLVGYREQTNNAFGYAQQVAFMPYNTYKVTSTVANQLPNYTLDANKTFIGTYNTPSNHFTIRNSGIELMSDIKLARPLSLQLAGAYIQTESQYTNDQYRITTDPTTALQRVGAYQNGAINSNEQVNTTLRSVIHIPELKFILSLTAQTIWYEKQRQSNYDALPYLLASEDGLFKPFDTTNAALVRDFQRNANTTNSNETPIWLVNINITKELGQFGKLSFFVNNLFNSRPVIANSLRNLPLFYGFEARIKI